MGWVLMSERDVQRIEDLTEVLAGKRTVASAVIVLAVSARQVGRLLIRLREDGGGGLVHKGRGQSSNHRVGVGVREYVLELVKTSTAFRVNRPDAKSGSGMTQYGRPLAELNIEILLRELKPGESHAAGSASEGAANRERVQHRKGW